MALLACPPMKDFLLIPPWRDISELFTVSHLGTVNRREDCTWPAPKDEPQDFYTNVSIGGESVMLSSCGKGKPCHIAPEGVRGGAHLHARLSNVIFAAALHHGQERIAYPPGPQPKAPGSELPLVKRADAVNFLRSALGGELAWVFRILTFAGESTTFPAAERVFALEDAAGFEPRAWDGNQLALVGATRSVGELLIGDMPEAGLFTGNVYSAIAYTARLAACRIVDPPL